MPLKWSYLSSTFRTVLSQYSGFFRIPPHPRSVRANAKVHTLQRMYGVHSRIDYFCPLAVDDLREMAAPRMADSMLWPVRLIWDMRMLH